MSVLARPTALLVEPSDLLRRRLQRAAEPIADVEEHRGFETARSRCQTGTFSFLITNIRLGSYNGLHLAYLCLSRQLPPRLIVYSQTREPGLAQEVHRAGAFYEVGDCLAVTLSAYMTGALPDRDRRSPIAIDRRVQFRGGRRCWDQHLSQPGA